MQRKDTDRFWGYVHKQRGKCWTWTGGYSGNGYGKFAAGGKSYRAHRIAYEIAHGAIPPGLQVLHDCDNPGCVNPAHLRLGTSADNMADKMSKGRHGGTSVRLTKEQRSELLEQRARGDKTDKELAQTFGISARAVAYHARRVRS